MKSVGWIGLGQMGVPMAMNLLKAGCAMHVYNRTPQKAAPLVAAGAQQQGSAREVAERSELLFLMLSNGQAVREVLLGPDGVLAGLTQGQMVVNMSTISPGETSEFADLVAAKGGCYVDAPVSGTVGPAVAGQLVILVGGSQDALAACQPYFDRMGKSTIHFGKTGAGCQAKLAINLLLGVVGQGIAETVLFAQQLGLDTDKVFDMISQSAVNTPMFQAKKEMLRTQQFPPAFKLQLVSKDLGLVEAERARMNLELPLATCARGTYKRAEELGVASLDIAAIFLALKAMSGLGPESYTAADARGNADVANL